MKAKEQAQFYNTSSDKQAAFLEICKDYWNEIGTLMQARHVKSDAGMISIFDELHKKMESFCQIDR